MPPFALTKHHGWRAAAAGMALLVLTFAALAAPQECGQTTVTHIQVPTQRPASCIAVQLHHATVLLDKALAEAHAKGLVASHPDDDHLSRLTSRRARDLLQAMTPHASLDACASMDGRERFDDWRFYVALQIDQGWAAVQPTGSDRLLGAVAVRERAMGCKHTFGDTATRVYGIPGGKWFLPLVLAIS